MTIVLVYLLLQYVNTTKQEPTNCLHFFGPVVFQYSLEEAIGHCLVEYDYHIHTIELTPGELDRWHELTMRIKKNVWRADNDSTDTYLAKLLRDRRAILENASNKLLALANCVDQENLTTLQHTLIYASDKAPEQLEAVNSLLNSRGVSFHQITYEETANREATKRILELFQNGTLQVLTAKRVLDEGVNIPQGPEGLYLGEYNGGASVGAAAWKAASNLPTGGENA